MASYLNVPDYIPHIQPFHPDFNFYQAALEKKESQYKEGYNKISGLYGSMLNSAMLRDDNNERRDQFFKDVNNNIQKISGMDLSLQENVDSAYKVFQPILDDQHIMHDIAYTKQYQRQLQTADSYRTIDPKKGLGQWWQQGVDYLNYKASDYKNADPNIALGMSPSKFTPNVNDTEMALDFAKQLGVKTIRSGVERDGYVHQIVNGPTLELPLRDMMTAAVGQDAKVMEKYKVLAFNEYHQFVDQAKAMGQDPGAAESMYMNQTMDAINQDVIQSNQTLDNNLKLLKAKYAVAKERADKLPEGNRGQADNALEAFMQQIQAAENVKSMNKEAAARADKSVLVGADKHITAESVVGAHATYLLKKAMAFAARDYSEATYEDLIKEPDFRVKASYEHALAMDLARFKEDAANNREMIKLQFRYGNRDQIAKGGISDNGPGAPLVLAGSATAPDTYKPWESLQTRRAEDLNGMVVNQREFLNRYISHYSNIATNSDDSNRQAIADEELGKLLGNKYDKSTHSIRGGIESLQKDPILMGNIYDKALASAKASTSKTNKLSSLFDETEYQKMVPYINEVDAYKKTYAAGNDLRQSNNYQLWNHVAYEASLPDKEREMLLWGFRATGDGKAEFGNITEWKKNYVAKYGGDAEDAQDAYAKTLDKFQEMYNHDPKLKAFDASATLGPAGGGRAAKSLPYDVRGIAYLSDNYKKAVELQQNFEYIKGNPDAGRVAYATMGGAAGTNDMAEVKDSPQAYAVYKNIMEMMKSKKDHEDTDFKVITSAVAGGDPNMTSYTIIPTAAVAEKLRGTKAKPGVAYESSIEDLTTNGVTLYMKRGDAVNGFARAFNTSRTDFLLNTGKGVRNDYGVIGSYNINRQGSANMLQMNYTDPQLYPGSKPGTYRAVYKKGNSVVPYKEDIDMEDVNTNANATYQELMARYQQIQDLKQAGLIESEEEQ